MEIITLLLVIVLGLAALLLIGYPLWQQTRPDSVFQVNRAGQTLEEYQARYEATLASIKDLMFDYEMGKVAEADYQMLLEKAKQEAANIRKNIDQRKQASADLPDAELDSEIEGLILAARQNAAAVNGNLLNAVAEEIERLRQAPAGGQTTGCPNCGSATLPGDAFCNHCGCALPVAPIAPLLSQNTTCAGCGSTVKPGDAFCAVCGLALTPAT